MKLFMLMTRSALVLCFWVVLSWTISGAAQAELWSNEVFYSTVNNCGSAGGNCLGYVTKQESFNASYDRLPKINNAGDIAWQSRAAGEKYDILLKRNGSEEVVKLSSNPLDDVEARINQSADVTWMGHDGNDWEIFLYSNGQTRQITSNDLEDKYPKINNSGEIVWIAGTADEQGKIENYNIFLYSGGVTSQITSNGEFNIQARINDSGDIMWRAKNQNSFNIFQRSGGVVSQVTDDDLTEMYPQLTSSGYMVWERYDGNDDEIMAKFSSLTEPVQITDNETNDCHPMINESGTVVWQKFDGNDWEIYVFSGGQTVRLTDNDFDDFSPQVNARGDIMWIGKEGSGSGIYLYQHSSKKISKLSDVFTGHYNPSPSLNDLGVVVWSGSYGDNFEITTSSP